jgi:hypothetical protein
MAQPPAPTQSAPAAAAVTAASAGPPLWTQGSVGTSHVICETQPFASAPESAQAANPDTRRRTEDNRDERI